ncbi:hypothetical protein BDY17DRAFT_127626 [Neohortaea acidophila]|uniref:Lytic polysaccharide monooxygenase n=1 Tax=Neohortaea acidophila TaxID=245834 RepID=A0A6A6PW50_9PEZI|nr:uncharacterized protein BDY17DRAFT_127626 [Neohortaea acidophila]KAF2484398.1 hypothetical protein BDY17DRAFT_127626 [Neohortaea acidophila]
MGSFLISIAVVALTFVALSNAHLKLMRPVPYGIDTLNKSPLQNVAPGASGSDFPCKLRKGVYDIVVMNNFTVGKRQELSFIGSVSHGGGTCQLTITKDKEPDATSLFKVFQVFEGGCPVNSNGNTGTHPFTFVLPKGMPNGVMTFAWIWYNRVGDREIYMNCCPVTVTGGSDDDSYFNSLPNAYIINLPTTECETSYQGESNAVKIPHPGQFILTSFEGQQMHAATGPNCTQKAEVQLDGVVGYQSSIITDNGAAYTGLPGNLPFVPHGSSGAVRSVAATAAPNGQPADSHAPGAARAGSAKAGSPSGAKGASGNPSPHSGIPTAPPASSNSSQALSSAATPALTFQTLTATSNAGVASSNGSVPTPILGGSSAADPSNIRSPTAMPSGGSCSSSSAAMTCSADGTRFGVCVGGKMVWRAVAPGTTCKNSQIARRDGLRSPHFPRKPRRDYIV